VAGTSELKSRWRKLLKEHFKRLVKAEDPISEVWRIFTEIWRPTTNLDEYFRLEEEANKFEYELNLVFFEIYKYLYNRIVQYTFKPILPTIILDGMSIREGSLLKRDLEREGYKVLKYGFGFSGLPSITQSFRERFRFEYIEVLSGKIPSKLNFEKPVWISYPDEILHHAAKIIPLPEAYERTKKLLLDLLGLVESETVTITSDHGYIMIDNVWPLAKGDVRFFKGRIFGTNRYAELSRIDPKDIEKLKTIPENLSRVFIDEKYCYVRGRYFWPIGGYGRVVAHGGLSLMECIVPKIVVKL